MPSLQDEWMCIAIATIPVGSVRRDHQVVEAASVIYREEVVAMLFSIADLNENVKRIVQLLEEEFDGGEAVPEDDS